MYFVINKYLYDINQIKIKTLFKKMNMFIFTICNIRFTIYITYDNEKGIIFFR